MHFAKISVVLVGLAAFVSALPNPSERGMTWAPRSLERRGGEGKEHKDKENIEIVDTTDVKLTEETRNSEVELTVLVEEKIKIEEQKKKAKDNVRKNHYRNKNKDVNTIITVVTEILDIRDSNNHNTRYMKHQLRADNKAKTDVTIQVTEVKVITISNSDSKHKGTKTKASHGHGHGHDHGSGATAASAAAASAIQTMDPNAPFTANNQTILMPSGAAAPQGQNVDFDPAAIVEDEAEELIVEKLSS